MSTAVRQRARVARVRALQHRLAAAACARAEAETAKLEGTAARLREVGGGLALPSGAGASLAAAGELRTRLDDAANGLAQPIDAARRVALDKADVRHRTDRDRRAADRLAARARTEAEAAAERAALAAWRRTSPPFGIER